MNPEDIRKILESLPEKEPPQGFRERLMTRVQKEKQEEARRKDTIRLAAGLAAVLVLFLTVRFINSGAFPFANLTRDRAGQEMNEPLATATDSGKNDFIKGNDNVEGRPGIPTETVDFLSEAGEVRLYVKDKAEAFASLRKMASEKKLKIIETAGDAVTFEITTKDQEKALFDELNMLGRVEAGAKKEEAGIRRYKVYIVLE